MGLRGRGGGGECSKQTHSGAGNFHNSFFFYLSYFFIRETHESFQAAKEVRD